MTGPTVGLKSRWFGEDVDDPFRLASIAKPRKSPFPENRCPSLPLIWGNELLFLSS
jgi:hypothetical protein